MRAPEGLGSLSSLLGKNIKRGRGRRQFHGCGGKYQVGKSGREYQGYWEEKKYNYCLQFLISYYKKKVIFVKKKKKLFSSLLTHFDLGVGGVDEIKEEPVDMLDQTG